VVAIAVATALAVTDPASAHATLSGSNPAPGAVLTRAPAAVTLHFDESVSTVPGSLRVLAPDGSPADTGVVHQSGDGSDISVDLSRATKHGSYFVSWRVVSADSHPISGAFTFAIGTTSAAPAAIDAQNSAGSGPGLALILGLGRWASYLGLVLLLGGVVFLSVCWPAGWAQRRARVLLGLGWALSLVAALVGLGLKGPYDAGLPLSQAGTPDLVTEVLATAYGKALLARLLLLAGIAIWYRRRRRNPDRARNPATPARWIGALAGVGFLATFTATGHAVAGSGRVLAFTADLAHLGAMASWVGGLVMLSTVLLRADQPAEAAQAVPVFSRLATASVAVLVVTGSYQGWRQVGSLPALAATTYGRELIVKLALVAVALSFGAAARTWVRRHQPSCPVVVYAASANDLLNPRPAEAAGKVTPAALRTLRRGLVVEAVAAILILAVTAALVATAPARTAYQPSVQATLQLGPDTAQVSAIPAGDRQMALHVSFFGPNGTPTTPQEVTATLRLPDQDLGPLPVTLQGMAAGQEMPGMGPGQETTTIAVPVLGDWTLTVSARTTAFDVYTKDVTLPIR
jgi:copper transport protein